jgi:flagellar protein FlgJ
MSIDNAGIYTDLNGLAALRHAAKQDQQQALPAVAKQFEALFMQTLLKNMRATDLGGGMLESDQTRFYRDMADDQLSTQLAKGKGLGIADMLVRQLSGKTQIPSSIEQHSSIASFTQSAAPSTSNQDSSVSPQAFVRSLWPYAQQAAARLGVDPQALLAQAALETGWGQRQINHPDGRPSFNFFGIKATGDWQGGKVNVPTLEYEDGIAVRRQDSFRAYNSMAEAFQDYAHLLSQNPRYQAALKSGGNGAAFADALQAAGYATDPNYAAKLKAIMRDANALLKQPQDQPLTG